MIKLHSYGHVNYTLTLVFGLIRTQITKELNKSMEIITLGDNGAYFQLSSYEFENLPVVSGADPKQPKIKFPGRQNPELCPF